STCDQVLPPSAVLYTPRSGFAPHKCPSAATYTTSGFFGWITIRPMCRVASSPIFFQVFPPSRDLYAPSPQEELWRLFGSPVPTHTIEGSDGAIAMSPIVDTPSLSNIGSHVVPLLVVFQTDRKSTRLNSSHVANSYAVFCVKKKRPPFGNGLVPGEPYTADTRLSAFGATPPSIR